MMTNRTGARLDGIARRARPRAATLAPRERRARDVGRRTARRGRAHGVASLEGVVIETREDREAARAAARRGDGARVERDGPTRSSRT